MGQDVRDAFRALRRAPAFSVVAILLLALAIGSATATFSVVDAILVRGLPYANASRLQTVYERSGDGALRVPSFPTFTDWQNATASVRDAIDAFAFVRGNGVLVGTTGEPERQIAAYVTPGFFDLMGTRPSVGRTFLPDEERPGSPRVAVISHDFFIRRFGGDASAALGKTIDVDSMPTTVVGVMPRGFAYPNFGGIGWLPPAVWQPISVFDATHAALRLRGLHVDSRALLRLRTGADSARAAAAMKTIQQRLAAEYPVEQAHWTSIEMRGLSDELFGQLGETLLLISGAIGLVLLLACANVANLLLVRNSVRAREIAVRSALGAGAWRIARHLLAEAAVIAIVAGVAGATLAAAIVKFLHPYAAQRLPFSTDITVNGRALLFVTGVSAVTALLIGLLPAFNSNAGDLVTRLRDGLAAGTATATRRIRNLLIVVQFALAITVLVAAGLLVQSVRRVSNVDLGYDTRNVVTFSVFPPTGRYDTPAQAADLYRRILEATRAIPARRDVGRGRRRAAADEARRGRPPGRRPGCAGGLPSDLDGFLSKCCAFVSIDGRAFTDADMRSPSGFLITETLAKRLWPGESAVGHRITVRRSSQARADFGQPITLPVVGVVADYREFGRETKPPEQVFLPYTLEVWPWMTFIVRAPRRRRRCSPRSRARWRASSPAIDFSRQAERRYDRDRPSRSADPRMFVATLMSGFAATALLLAAIGLYGVVAYGVTQRTREIGIRIAIGASSGNIMRLVMGQAVLLVVAGVAARPARGKCVDEAREAHCSSRRTPTDAGDVRRRCRSCSPPSRRSRAWRPRISATRTEPIIAMRAE